MIEKTRLNDLEFWLQLQTWPDARQFIHSYGERPFVHPYGFTVVRLNLPYINGWQVRVHFWRNKLDTLANLSIHRHGAWDLMSKVLVGTVKESRYEFLLSDDGPYREYAVTKSIDNARSVIKVTGRRATLGSLDTHVRSPRTGLYRVGKDVFHSTKNNRVDLSVTLALTEVPARVTPAHIMSESDAQLLEFENKPVNDFDQIMCNADDLYLEEIQPADQWASFVFVVSRESKLLMARTRRSPEVWMPIGGRASASDTSPMETAVRELAEEASILINSDNLRFIGSQPRDVGPGLTHFWVLQLNDKMGWPRPDYDELQEAAWFTIGECAQLPLLAGTKAILEFIKPV